MLNEEKLSAIEGLTDDQKKAILTVANQETQIEVDARTKKVREQVEEVVSEFGFKRGSMKATDFVRRALTDFKGRIEKAGEWVTEKEQLTAQIADLKKAIADGSHTSTEIKQLKQQLKDSKDELNAKLQGFENEKQTFIDEINGYKTSIRNSRFTSVFDKVNAKTSFNVADEVKDMILPTIQDQIIKSIKLREIDDGQGGKITVVTGENDTILRDAKNGHKPHTLETFYKEKISKLVKVERKQKGAGGQKQLGQQTSTLDMSGVTTQMQASETFKTHIIEVLGIPKNDPRHDKKATELWNEHKINDLPFR